jgi:hypothetical protein
MGHRSSLAVMALVIGNDMHSIDPVHKFIDWLSYYAILAGFITDLVIYPKLQKKLSFVHLILLSHI